MAKFNLKPVKVARYQRNSLDIASALKTLKASSVTAISLVGTYKPLSVFINNAYEQQFSTEYPSEVIVTEVAPNPDKCSSIYSRSTTLHHAITARMLNAALKYHF